MSGVMWYGIVFYAAAMTLLGIVHNLLLCRVQVRLCGTAELRQADTNF